MATSCACKYKCGNAKITFNKDTVAKNEPFTMTIEPRKKQLDVTTNQLSSVPYTPENIFQISALGDGKAIGLHVPTYEWADNKAVIEGCYFTGDPPEGKLEVTVNISVTDPTPPSEGECGSATMTLRVKDWGGSFEYPSRQHQSPEPSTISELCSIDCRGVTSTSITIPYDMTLRVAVAHMDDYVYVVINGADNGPYPDDSSRGDGSWDGTFSVTKGDVIQFKITSNCYGSIWCEGSFTNQE